MMPRKKNFEIVLSALIAGEQFDYTLVLPDGFEYGWADGRLCMVAKVWLGDKSEWVNGEIDWSEPDERRWLETSMPLNDFARICDQIPEADMVNIVYQASQLKLRS